MIILKVKNGYMARFWLGCYVNVVADTRADVIRMAIEYIYVHKQETA